MSYVLDISMLTDELVELVELLPKLKMLSFETRQAIRDYLNTFFAHGIQADISVAPVTREACLHFPDSFRNVVSAMRTGEEKTILSAINVEFQHTVAPLAEAFPVQE